MLLRLLHVLARMPLRGLHAIGAILGWVLYGASPNYRARLKENLFASGVCTEQAACKRLLRQTIGEAGKGVTELIAVWFGPEPALSRWVTCQGWEVAEEAKRAGRGVIFLTPHLGCFEIAGLFIAQRMPITVLYRPPKLPWLEPLMIAGRQRWHARLAPASLRGVRMQYRALKRGETVGLLPDQTPGVGEGVWAEFFGRPAYTMSLVRRLQQATRAPVIMTFAERLSKGRGYRLRFESAPEGEFDEVALNTVIERMVRSCPAQYLWSYNRYKLPPGSGDTK